MKLFNRFVTAFVREVRKARLEIDDAKYKELRQSIATRKSKRSKVKVKLMADEFERSVKDAFTDIYVGINKRGYEQTVFMGGRVLIRILTRTNNLERELDCEMIARKIPTDMKEFTEEYGLGNAVLKEMSILDKRKMLKLHEAQLLAKENANMTLEEAKK